MKTYQDDVLQQYVLKDFRGGYNSYSGSKSNLNDNEFPIGQNVELDDNGSVTKSAGTAYYGTTIVSSKAITGLGWLKNSSHNKVIVSAGTAWYYNNGTTTTALTGVSFTDNKKTYFIQALDRLYGVNASDTLAYTTNGSTISTQSGGRAGISAVFFNQRIYLIDATTGRIWYSCAYTVTVDTTPGISVGFLGDFGTKLTGTVGVDFKDAGFIELFPGGGVEPVNLTVFGNTIKVLTKNHGVWEISPTTVNADKSVAHIVTQKVMKSNTPSPKGVTINGADIWFPTGQGITSYGEVAQFQSPRPQAKSGRIRSEMNGVADALKSEMALYTFNEKVYTAYGTGTYNDHLIKFDNRLNAFSASASGINISCFMEYVDDAGARRLLAGSSDSANPYVYQLETGTDLAGGIAMDAYFEHKSIDVGHPGQIKYFAFADVFYSLLYGTLTYTSYVNETIAVAGSQVVGSSSTFAATDEFQIFGTYLVGFDFTLEDQTGTNTSNGHFRIDLEFTEGDKVSTKLANANTGEQFKIDKIIYYYMLSDSIYQQ